MACDVNEERVKLKITEQFLEVLVDAAKTFGHYGDHPATCEFVEWAHELVGAEVPDLLPHVCPDEESGSI